MNRIKQVLRWVARPGSKGFKQDVAARGPHGRPTVPPFQLMQSRIPSSRPPLPCPRFVCSERACQELNPIRQAQMKKAIHLM